MTPKTLGRPLRYVETGGFVVIESAYAPGAALPTHSHDEAFLTFSVRGAFSESVGTTMLACKTFDVIVRPAGAPHTNRYTAGARCVLVGLSRQRLDEVKGATTLFDAPLALPRSKAAPLAFRLARELETFDSLSPLALESLVLELITAGARRPKAEPADAPPWLAAARDYVHANWSSDVTLSAVAGAAGVHPATVARAFRRHFGCSAGEYARRLRIEHASRELSHTSKPVVQIALEAGFYDHSHFGNVFRRHVGMSPAEYRAAFRG